MLFKNIHICCLSRKVASALEGLTLSHWCWIHVLTHIHMNKHICKTKQYFEKYLNETFALVAFNKPFPIILINVSLFAEFCVLL